MGLFILLQVALDLAVIAVMTWMLIERVRGRRREEMRVSRGLQLVSNKIAVLQDVIDRADQFDKQSQKNFESRRQSLQEMMEDFERRMGHQGASVRETAPSSTPAIESSTIYVEAAKLAARGMTLEEIATRIPVPRNELELIVKVQKAKSTQGHALSWSASGVACAASTATGMTSAPTIASPSVSPTAPTGTAASATAGAQTSDIKPVVFRKIEVMPVR